ncbi:MAG: alpha/beta hydrolase [Desulfuromonadales bacterium]|nr:alpha/beta hydrolase [Desulfuromonadales bacterium]
MAQAPRRPVLLLFFILSLFIFPTRGDAMLEETFLYFPEKHLYATPAALGLAYREVHFPADDGTSLHGWYLPGEPDRPLLLFFHGNAGNISHRLDNLKHLRELGLSTFIFDYRGYGNSLGTISEQGTYSDARGALDYLLKHGWSADRMIYFGRSLGAAVALQMALENPPAALVMESPFTSVSAMGRHHYPLLSLLAGWLLQARYDNLRKIAELKAPLLILQGERDTIVPPGMAHQLYRKAPQPKQLIMLPDAGHNDTYDRDGDVYWRKWRELIDALAAKD